MSIEYMERQGKREGLLDNLFKTPYNTVESRAQRAFDGNNYKTHFKAFLTGYKIGVTLQK